MNVRYATIIVKDMEESVGFYTGIMGFEVESVHDLAPRAMITILRGEGDARIELIKNSDDEHGFYSIGMDVQDMDSIIRDITSKGATITMGPVPITVGRLAFLEDPNGVRIALIEHS